MSEDDFLFKGLKVLDVGNWIAGPVAGTMLADRGADVIKVEEPVNGDGYRNHALAPFNPQAEANYTWALDARNKRSLTLNLKSEEGMKILRRLIVDCDVYVTNQPLPLRRNLGLRYEDIRSLNERMIYASLTPYGERGPDTDKAAFDVVAYWNRSGLMNEMRPAGAEPVQALAGMGDHPTAVAMYASIVTALLRRERTGKGGMASTSLLANGVWASSCMTQARFANADFSTTSMPRPMNTLYEAKDGRWIQLNMVRRQDEIDRMLIAMEAFDAIADGRFSTLEARQQNAAAFIRLLRDIFATRTSAEWLQLLRIENGLSVERVAVFDDVVTDPHLKLNNIVSSPIEPVGMDYIINDPVNAEGVPKVGARKAPAKGEHTEEVLAEMGYTDVDIERLREAGVVS